MNLRLFYALLLLFSLSFAFGQDHHHHAAEVEPLAAHVNVTSVLPSSLVELLRQEMNHIKQGVGQLSGHLATGDWEQVQQVAEKIRDSFIIRQSMTEQDRHALHEKMPPAFLQKDRHFHQTAGKLAEAAVKQDHELSLFYFTRLLEGCGNCHAAHAQSRFPGLKPGN